MRRKLIAKRKRERSGEHTSSPGEHPLTTEQEACATQFFAPHLSSSVIRPNKPCGMRPGDGQIPGWASGPSGCLCCELSVVVLRH
jgi:hypothetical protein